MGSLGRAGRERPFAVDAVSVRHCRHAPSLIPNFHGGQCRWQVLALHLMAAWDVGEHLRDDGCSRSCSWGRGRERESLGARLALLPGATAQGRRLLGCLGSKRAAVCVLGRTHPCR